MKHHFADFLDREGDYWKTVPNKEKYAYLASDAIEDKQAVRILTISKHHENWQQVFACPNLEELTLLDPNKEQAEAIQELTQLKRLRITFFRPTDIEFMAICLIWKNSCLNTFRVSLTCRHCENLKNSKQYILRICAECQISMG